MHLHPARIITLAAVLALPFFFSFAQEDGGPDHHQVRGISKGGYLTLRAKPDQHSPALARIPADAVCLPNLGCKGGLTMREFTTLSEAEKKKRAAANPRWCKVEYLGKTGWLLGQYLAEGACLAPPQ